MTDTINLNLDGVDTSEGPYFGPMLEPGTYTARIVSAAAGKAGTGTPSLEVRWACEDGQIRDWLYITESSRWRIRQLLEAIGYEIPSGRFGLDPDKLVGAVASILVVNKPYEGKDRFRVKECRPASAGANPGFHPEADDAPKKAAPVAAGGADPWGTDDDSIPFAWSDPGVLDLI